MLELEARLLAAIPDAECFGSLEAHGLSVSSFNSFGEMYVYIADMVTTYGRVPRLIDLSETFNLPLEAKRSREEFDWLLDEMLKVSTAKRIQDIVERNIGKFGQEPQLLVAALLSDLSGIQTLDRRHASLTDVNCSSRMDEYAKKADDLKGLISGIPTGIRYFDLKNGIGWQPGELVGIVGRTYIGKSWLLLNFGFLAWRAGHSILLLSPEMTIEETETRFDALLFGNNGVNVDISDLYKGHHPSAAMRETALVASNSARWKTYSSIDGRPFRLREISQLIRQDRPSLVLIDGLPLLNFESSARQSTWEAIKEISYGLKNVAVGRDVPILITHQATRSAADTLKPPQLHEISYGDAFAQACDRVLALSRRAKERHILRVTVQKFRRGESMPGGTDFDFDPSRGIIHERDPNTSDFGKLGPNGEDGAQWSGDESIMPLP